MKIDWAQLRRQKETLVGLVMAAPPPISDDLGGILSIIDALQDEAVEDGTATEEEVFGVDAIVIDIKSKRRL